MHAECEATRQDCPGCHGGIPEDCSAHDAEGRPPLSGWRLALISLGMFLGPAVLAVLGAACGGGSGMRQFLGGTAGLGLGMGVTLCVSRFVGRTREADGDDC